MAQIPLIYLSPSQGQHVGMLMNPDLKLFKQHVKKFKNLAKIDDQDNFGETLLMKAIHFGDIEKFKILIKAGADIYVRNSRGENALEMVGKRWSDSDLMARLLIQKVEKDCSYNKAEIAERLIGAKWPLCKILLVKEADVTKIALDRGYDTQILQLETRMSMGMDTALHVAVKNVDVDNVKLLLEYVSYVHARSQHYRTPLSYIYNSSPKNFKKRLEILKMFLDQTTGPLKAIQDFENLLRYVDKEAMELLLQHGIDLSVTDLWDGYEAIHYLARNKNPGVIQQLDDKNFNVNASNRNGVTALMEAARLGNASAVEFLLDQGADIEQCDSNHRTALFYALEKASGSDEECQQTLYVLLERGANAFRERLDGSRTTFDVILKEKYSWAVDILMAHLALEELKGAPITELIRSRVYSKDQFKDYFELSKQQLKIKIYESLTLFDLLTATAKKLECYVRNKELVSKTQEHCSESGNSYYFHTTLKKRLSKAISVVALKYEAAQIICRIMKMNYEIFPLIADQIINYLDQQSTKNFIDALS